MTTDYQGQQWGNYRLLRLLGQGGFADVYLAEHVRLGMKAAIKLLHTRLTGEQSQAFQQEARIIADLKHPHIIRVLDFDVQAGIPFLVLDYASQGSLRQKYPRGTRLPLPVIADYVMQLASALQYAHDHQLIHRDIKPENMLIGEQGELLLSDFGIATIAHSTSSMNTQASMGTLAYMPPEQIQGKPRKESDQYALAVTVYQWLTGELPFQGSSSEMIAQHLAVAPPSLCGKVPGLPLAVEQVVLKALAKDPKERFERVQDFATALKQAIEQPDTMMQSTQQGMAATQLAPTQPAAGSPAVAPTVFPSPPAQMPVLPTTPASPITPMQAWPPAQGGVPFPAPPWSAPPRQRTSPTVIVVLVVVVLAVVVIGGGILSIFIYLPHQQSAMPQQQATAAFRAVSSLNSQTFGSVGAGSVTPGFLHPVNTAVLKGADGKPEVFYVGGEYCPFCAVQRWGMIAALSRFGTLSPLTPISSSESNIPTFTFEGYKYSSPYIDLAAKEISGQSQTQPLDTLTPQEQQIFNTYDTAQYMGASASPGAIPFISIANQYVSQGSYASPAILQGLSYQQIEQQLQEPTSDVAKGIVGTANYLTAAICKVTNNQPANVCTANPVPSLQSSLVQVAPGTSGAPQLALAPDMSAIFFSSGGEIRQFLQPA